MREVPQHILKQLLDARNKGLFDYISEAIPLSIMYGNEKNYGVYQRNGQAVVFVPEGDLSPASFAHELLHLRLSLCGVNIGGSLKSIKNQSQTLSLLISDALADHITNVLEHRKMYQWYIKLGYDKMDFLSDARTPVLTIEDIQQFKRLFKKKLFFRNDINVKAVDFFIGKYLSAKGACIGIFDYSNLLSDMEKIEPDLCSVIDSLIARWDIYDETKEGNLDSDSYNSIAFDFLEGVSNWSEQRTSNRYS